MRRKTERRERLRTERGKRSREKSLNSEEKVKKQQQLDWKKRKVWRIVKTKRQTEGGEET